MMIRVFTIAITLAFVSSSLALPFFSNSSDSAIAMSDNEIPSSEEEDGDLRSYFSKVTEIMKMATGEPQDESGEKVSGYDENSGMNPEELGGYLQGDILMPSSVGRNGLVSESARWGDGLVPYQIDSSFGGSDRKQIQKAFNEYHRRTCIKFVPHTSQRDYLVLTKARTGCWSSVGRIGGRQEVNLQSPGCTSKVGTVIHELMHAIGFMHEQNRSERDNYVTIMWANIERGRENNFELARQGSVNGFGVDYDYSSVMHYSDRAFSVNDRPTIVSKASGVTLGQREGFSTGDVRKIRAMYRCGSPR